MHEPLPMRLRVLRAEKGWTVEEAADRAGLTRDSLSRLERGLRHPRATTLARIARAYGVDTEELLGLEEPALPKAPAPSKSGQPEAAAQPKTQNVYIPGPDDEGEEGFAPTLKHDYDSAFNRMVADLRAEGVGDAVIRKVVEARREELLMAAKAEVSR
jgi:transcriptional regulator with XRE-family HTH domain